MTESTPGQVPGLPPPTSEEGGGSVSDRMQSLLSHAVQEQLTEQRQVAGTLADVRALLARLPQDVQAATRSSDPRIDRLSTDLSGFADQVETALRVLTDGLDVVSRAVHERGGELADVRARLGELGDELRGHLPVLEALRGAMDALPAFPESVGALREEVAGLHDQLGSVADLHESVADLSARTAPLDGLAIEIRAVRAVLDERDQQIGSVPDRDELEQAFARMAGLIEQIPDRVPNANDRLDAIESRLTQLADGGQDREELTGLTERLTAIEERLTALADTDPAAGVRPHVEELAGRMEGVDERLGAITQALTGVAALGERLPILLEAVRQVQEEMAELGTVRDDFAVVQSLLTSDSGVVADVAAVRTTLDSLAGRLDALGGRSDERSQLVDAVAGLVRTASAETERRLTAHVDETVLVLAEALLRRKPPRSAAAGLAAALAQPPAVPDAADETDDADEPDDADESAVSAAALDMVDEQAGLAVEPDYLDEDEESDVEDAGSLAGGASAAEVLADLSRDADEEESLDEDDESPVPWTIRSAGPVTPEAAPESPPPAGRKRRPWWRPGG